FSSKRKRALDQFELENMESIIEDHTCLSDGDSDSGPICKRSKLDFVDSEELNKKSECLTKTIAQDETNGKAFATCHSVEDEILITDTVNVKQLPLTEVQAGITEYLGTHTGFNAIIKQRYSDFIVNEVDQEGCVVHLTNLLVPEEDTEDQKQPVKEKPDCLCDEDLEKLEKLVKEADKNKTVDITAPECKDLRTKIHICIKTRFTQLETKTLEKDGQKIIQALWKTGNSRGSNREEWPKSQKLCPFVKFVLYKENKDTMDAIGLIAKTLKLKESLFQYAGTKDKRAKTSQEVTANRVHPKKLVFLNKVLRNMALGNFRYVPEPLKLGQLSGNEFTIVLRNVEGDMENIDKALSALKSLGFINYFGMQRFGTTSVPTHKIGCALLHGDWDKAIDLILMPRDDNPAKDEFQKVWMATHDPKATLEVTPRYCGLERNLLTALKNQLKPFNALEKISRNTRLLYVHSYQALVWNLMTSRRLKQLGSKVVVGDLVITKEAHKTDHPNPTVVTLENISDYSLHDVVLPLPGHDVIYPQNEVRDWYRSTLEADGLNIDDMKRHQKDYSLPGAYRHVAILPSTVEWSHHTYDDYTTPLTLSDLDLINKVELPATCSNAKYRAVACKLKLPSSCYATMALREILRTDTSAAYQTSLNVGISW
ncbi:unnamed protein product, partial [Lymnaea stagnalis]